MQSVHNFYPIKSSGICRIIVKARKREVLRKSVLEFRFEMQTATHNEANWPSLGIFSLKESKMEIVQIGLIIRIFRSRIVDVQLYEYFIFKLWNWKRDDFNAFLKVVFFISFYISCSPLFSLYSRFKWLVIGSAKLFQSSLQHCTYNHSYSIRFILKSFY